MPNQAVKAVTGKLGPLPVWAWALTVSIPLIGARLYMAHKAAAEAAAAAATPVVDPNDPNSVPATGTPTPLTSSNGVPTAGLYAAGNPGGVYPTDSYDDQSTGTGKPTDNYAWINVAGDYMVGKLGYQSSTVLSALRKVIDGNPVTDAEEAIYNAAVRAVGNPPDAIPSIQRAATTAPTASGPTPAAGPQPIQQVGGGAGAPVFGTVPVDTSGPQDVPYGQPFTSGGKSYYFEQRDADSVFLGVGGYVDSGQGPAIAVEGHQPKPGYSFAVYPKVAALNLYQNRTA